MSTPENIYERIISNRDPNLDQKAKERAVRSLREIDKHRDNLSKIVGPNIGLQLLFDLASGRLSELSTSKTARLIEEESVESEYNRANLKSASEKVLAQTFNQTSYGRYYLFPRYEIDKIVAEWQALEKDFPPYADRISLLREILKKVEHPYGRKFYFHKLGPQIYGRTENLLSLFLNARGLYPTSEPSETDYQVESEEMIETLGSVVPLNNKKIMITPEEVMGLYLAGRLKVARQFSTFPFTPLSVLDLPIRAHNALYRAGVESVEELQWLSLPENERALLGIRNLGDKGLIEVREHLDIYKQNKS